MFLPNWLDQNRDKHNFSEKPNRLVVFAQLVGQRQIRVKFSEAPNRLEVFARLVGETQIFCEFFSKHQTSTQVYI
jgi:hypothetical protein